MNLLAEGAFVGRLDELLTPEEYSHFIDQSIIAREFIQDNRNLLSCRYDHSDRKDHEDHSISIDLVHEMDKHIKDNGFTVHQKWYYLNHGGLPNEYFRDLTILITKKHYPDFPKDISNQFWGNATFTLYEEGNFINVHKDGLDPDRLCVVLIYFSDPESYTQHTGGELVITTAHDETKKVEPVLGNYCVLDFSENNLHHSVSMVNGDFKRYTYVHFIESDDFVEYLHPQKKKIEVAEMQERNRKTETEKTIKKHIYRISILEKENINLKEALRNKGVKKKLL
jgi:Rps23 Pro-64 3,4-dihydroxylase Tpa1-like proline 4-hydroxylase